MLFDFPLKSERLKLDLIQESDAPFIYKITNTNDYKRWIGDREIHTLDDADYYIKTKIISAYNKFGTGLFKMIRKEDQQTIGMCGLLKRDMLDSFDLGFALLPDFYKKGYSYEASTLLLKTAKTIPSIKKVYGITNTQNDASRLLLEKLGFLKEDIIYFGEPIRTCYLYTLNLKQEVNL